MIVLRKGKIRWRTAELAIEKRIPFGQVVGVHIRPAGPLKRGCIEFIVDGWARGDHAILFTHHQQPAFEALSRAVTQKVAEISCSPAALGRRGFAEEASMISPRPYESWLGQRLECRLLVVGEQDRVIASRPPIHDELDAPAFERPAGRMWTPTTCRTGPSRSRLCCPPPGLALAQDDHPVLAQLNRSLHSIGARQVRPAFK